MTRPRRTLVLGIGNVLWADEGFGVRAVETFYRHHACPDDVLVMDGGTQGLYLVPHVQAADNLLVFDAVDYGRRPGDMIVVRGEEVPRFTGARKMSLHQTGFQDVLSAANLLGGGPDRLTLIGVQAADLATWGGPLTNSVRDRIGMAIETALCELDHWGVAVTERAEPLDPARQGLLRHGIDLDGFERQSAAT